MFRVLCIVHLSIILVLSELSDYIAFDLSTGLQSSQLPISTISSITTSLTGVKNYKFYGHSVDHSIATAILSASSDPDNIKFYIEILPNKVNNLSQNDIVSLLSEWSDVRGNVEYIALGNEPADPGNGINFGVLPDKLRMVYEELPLHSGWDHVKVSIPFSQKIMDKTFPVDSSTFKQEYKSTLTKILQILKDNGAAFSANIYPFFVLPSNPELLQYCLGNVGDHTGTYGSMIEAQYDSLLYAMKDVGFYDVEVMITETGWSSHSSDPAFWFATFENANTYLVNTLNLMSSSSSKIYNVKIFFFELFDEDLKGGGEHEQHFGIYGLNGNIKYGNLPFIKDGSNGNGNNNNNNNNNVFDEIQTVKDKCLSGINNNGGTVEISECNNQIQQSWNIMNGNIINEGGKCLDVHYDDYVIGKNGAIVQMWDCNGWNNQKWSRNGQEIVSGNGKCLDIHLSDFNKNINGQTVQLWDCAGSDNQKWNV